MDVRLAPATDVTDSRILFANLDIGIETLSSLSALRLLQFSGRFAGRGTSRMATRFTFFAFDRACLVLAFFPFDPPA